MRVVGVPSKLRINRIKRRLWVYINNNKQQKKKNQKPKLQDHLLCRKWTISYNCIDYKTQIMSKISCYVPFKIHTKSQALPLALVYW